MPPKRLTSRAKRKKSKKIALAKREEEKKEQKEQKGGSSFEDISDDPLDEAIEEIKDIAEIMNEIAKTPREKWTGEQKQEYGELLTEYRERVGLGGGRGRKKTPDEKMRIKAIRSREDLPNLIIPRPTVPPGKRPSTRKTKMGGVKFGTLQTALKNIEKAGKEFTQRGVEGAKGAIGGAIEGAKSAITGAVESAVESAKSTVQQSFSSAVDAAREQVGLGSETTAGSIIDDLVGGALTGAVKELGLEKKGRALLSSVTERKQDRPERVEGAFEEGSRSVSQGKRRGGRLSDLTNDPELMDLLTQSTALDNDNDAEEKHQTATELITEKTGMITIPDTANIGEELKTVGVDLFGEAKISGVDEQLGGLLSSINRITDLFSESKRDSQIGRLIDSSIEHIPSALMDQIGEGNENVDEQDIEVVRAHGSQLLENEVERDLDEKAREISLLDSGAKNGLTTFEITPHNEDPDLIRDHFGRVHHQTESLHVGEDIQGQLRIIEQNEDESKFSAQSFGGARFDPEGRPEEEKRSFQSRFADVDRTRRGRKGQRRRRNGGDGGGGDPDAGGGGGGGGVGGGPRRISSFPTDTLKPFPLLPTGDPTTADVLRFRRRKTLRPRRRFKCNDNNIPVVRGSTASHIRDINLLSP